MPKVKRKVAKRSAPKSQPRRSARRGGGGIFAGLVGVVRNYALAATAGVGVILAGVVAVLWAGGYFGLIGERLNRMIGEAALGAGLEVRQVTLSGRRQAASDEIRSALGPVIGAPLLHLDPEAARRRIEALGWVRAASVTRLFPGTIHIAIAERAPAAVWQVSGQLYLIDASGAVIREIGAYEYSSLPLVVGAGAPDAAAEILGALADHPEIADRAAALVRVSERRWNLRLRNGVDVKLPDSGYAEALKRLADLQTAHGLLDRELEYIDVRNSESSVFRRRGAVEQDVGR